jgi:hypothetical protein
MATLMPSLSSDDENDIIEDEEKEADDDGDYNQDFVFGGVIVRPICVSSICSFLYRTTPLTL